MKSKMAHPSREELFAALKEMKMTPLIEPLKKQFDDNIQFSEMCFEDRIRLIVKETLEQFIQRKIARLYKNSGYRGHLGASWEKIDFSPERNLNREVVKTLMDMDWVRGETPRFLLITGAAGTGKTYLTEAIIKQACDLHLSVAFYDFETLAADVELEGKLGRLDALFNKINRKSLVIIDDFALIPVQEEVIKLVHRLIKSRYGNKALIMTSQFCTDDWYSYIAGEDGSDKGLAEAIMDRLINNSYTIELQGKSKRPNHRPKPLGKQE